MTTINDILMTYDKEGFLSDLGELRAKILNAAYWPEGDDRHASLVGAKVTGLDFLTLA